MWQSSTTKILVGVLSLIITGSGLLFWRLSQSPNKPLGSLEAPLNPQTSATTSSQSDSERIRNLELSVSELISVIKNQSPAASANLQGSSTSLESRVKLLETTVADLQARVKTLETGKVVTSSTSTSTKPPTFIPLSWSGTTTSSDWTSNQSVLSSFNLADYPGATSVTFGVSIKTDSSGGRAYARMFNSDDNSVVSASEVSTDAINYAGIESGTFTLPSSRKTYYLQIKSTTNFQAIVQNAWLKVNY